MANAEVLFTNGALVTVGAQDFMQALQIASADERVKFISMSDGESEVVMNIDYSVLASWAIESADSAAAGEE